MAAKKRVKVVPPKLERAVEKEIRWFIKDISADGHLVDPVHRDYGDTYNPFDYHGYSTMEDAQDAMVQYASSENDDEYRTPTLYNNQTYGTRMEFFIIPQIQVRVFHKVVE